MMRRGGVVEVMDDTVPEKSRRRLRTTVIAPGRIRARATGPRFYKLRLMNRNLTLLAFCQGLFLTNNVVFIAINGLVGLSLAPLGWMATLPVMGYVVGGALSTSLVAKTQSRYGRRASFQIGLGVALLSALLCAYAVWSRNFWLLVTATVVAGYYSANGQLYRFAAAELSPPAFREKAVSLVMAGGLIGAVIGPNLAARTKGLFEVPFAGAYLSLAAGGRAVDGIDGLRAVSARAAQGGRQSGRAQAVRDHAPAGVRRGRRQRGAELRRDEPADGSHAAGHAGVWFSVLRRGTGAGVARDRHVRAGVLHRASDQALRQPCP